MTSNVIALGFFLVGATILGIVLDVALSFGSNKSLVAAVGRAAPHTTVGHVMVIVAMLSAAWVIYSVAIVFRGRRHPRMITNEDYYDRQARLRLETKRRLSLLTALLALIPIAVVVVLLSRLAPSSIRVYLVVGLSPFIVVAWAALAATFASKPVTAREIFLAADRARDMNHSEATSTSKV